MPKKSYTERFYAQDSILVKTLNFLSSHGRTKREKGLYWCPFCKKKRYFVNRKWCSACLNNIPPQYQVKGGLNSYGKGK